MGCFHGALVAVLLRMLLLAAVRCSAAACNSGILQLNPDPTASRPQGASDCFWLPPTANSIKAVCGATLKINVVKGGVVKVAPLSRETVKYSGPDSAVANIPFNCQDMKAAGLFAAGSTTDARITLYDNRGGPLSNLTRMGPNQITLSPGVIYGYMYPQCKFNYTVISGCVFGIRAPATPPACPSGFHISTGAGGTKFCAPCPAGTSSRGPNAAACAPCPPGTFSNTLASPCNPCALLSYSSKPGATACRACLAPNYSDGTMCKPCPAGSSPDGAYRGRCVKCVAGRKCCTVGAGPGCPACKPGTKATRASSVFALESAAPASCLSTDPARCAPMVNIIVDEACTIFINNNAFRVLDNSSFGCFWQEALPMKGVAPSIKDDLSQFPDWTPGTYSHSLLQGNVPAAKAPYLDFTIPVTGCKLRYRALTKPVAALLGAAPQPAPPGACPRGQYRNTSTDAPPGPCLPCPPGTYSPSPGVCTPCRPGSFAANYGALACTRCPRFQVSEAGAGTCDFCKDHSTFPSGAACKPCPRGSSSVFESVGRCLAVRTGNVCCAAGDCGQDPKCSVPLPPGPESDNGLHSVFRVVSVKSSVTACRNATLLKCLKVDNILALYAAAFTMNINLNKVGFACSWANGERESPPTEYSGAYVGATRAYIYREVVPGITETETYELLSNSTSGTVTMYPAPNIINGRDLPTIPVFNTSCSATLQLVTGAAFDLKAPAGATCPPNMIPKSSNGVTFCEYCSWSTHLSGGTCVDCSGGTYTDVNGATKCTPCSPGTYCSPLPASLPAPCKGGTYAAKAGQTQCAPCPTNTYSNRPEGATGCLPCPKGQVSPKGATVCSVPF